MTIAEILKDGYTVCHPPYMGDQRSYITYQCMGQVAILYADGVEKISIHAPRAGGDC